MNAADTHAHGTVHVNVGRIDGVIVAHADGAASIRLNSELGIHVWLHGTPEQLHDFASEMHRHANRAARELVRQGTPDVLAEPMVLPKVDAA